MWNCEKCHAEVEDDYFECWKCSAHKPGVESRVEWFDTVIPGRLLVLPKLLLQEWFGVETSTPGVLNPQLERAWAVEGWLGAIEVGCGQALVLNDIPMSAGFFERGGKLCILRWLCAESSKSLLELVESQVPAAETAPPVPFTSWWPVMSDRSGRLRPGARLSAFHC
jgi:hypothetical protein